MVQVKMVEVKLKFALCERNMIIALVLAETF